MELVKISQDGDKVCVLQGENLQEGVAGFGDTIEEAIADFGENKIAEAVKKEPEKQFSESELKQILSLIEIVLDEDLLDAEPMNSYSHYGNEFTNKLDEAWKSLSLRDKIKQILNPESPSNPNL